MPVKHLLLAIVSVVFSFVAGSAVPAIILYLAVYIKKSFGSGKLIKTLAGFAIRIVAIIVVLSITFLILGFLIEAIGLHRNEIPNWIGSLSVSALVVGLVGGLVALVVGVIRGIRAAWRNLQSRSGQPA